MARREQRNRQQMNQRRTEPEQRKEDWKFNTTWILVPLALLGMAYLLHNSESSITWEAIMDLLDVQNRRRYTMLFHLGLICVLVVAAVRILGRKNKK